MTSRQVSLAASDSEEESDDELSMYLAAVERVPKTKPANRVKVGRRTDQTGHYENTPMQYTAIFSRLYK